MQLFWYFLCKSSVLQLVICSYFGIFFYVKVMCYSWLSSWSIKYIYFPLISMKPWRNTCWLCLTQYECWKHLYTEPKCRTLIRIFIVYLLTLSFCFGISLDQPASFLWLESLFTKSVDLRGWFLDHYLDLCISNFSKLRKIHFEKMVSGIVPTCKLESKSH